jgi:hypothetical protein
MNSQLDEIVKAFGTQPSSESVAGFLLSLVLTAAATYVMGHIYVRYGRSISNRKAFASNFVLVGLSTMLIITIVRSSIALSLGLVGALSIVRFRTAIKEPEELAFIFFIITLGLGFGADQKILTLIGFGAVAAVAVLRHRFRQDAQPNMFLSVRSEQDGVDLARLGEVIGRHAARADLRRFDTAGTALEASYVVEFASVADLQRLTADLKQLAPALQVSFHELH